MSLGEALLRMRAVHKFYVDRTPLKGPMNNWSGAYFYWEHEDTRSLLRKRDPRGALAEVVVESVRYWNRLKKKSERFGRMVTPTEMMLLAAILGLPGERFSDDRRQYDLTLDAWTKAVRRAEHRTKKPRR